MTTHSVYIETFGSLVDRAVGRLAVWLMIVGGLASSTATGQTGDWFYSYRTSSNLVDEREVQARRTVLDDQGFLWCATPAGLYRYDGYEYLSAAELLSDSLQTYLATITNMANYTEGQIIIGTASGHLLLLSTTDGLIEMWDMYGQLGLGSDALYITQTLRSLYVDEDGTIWAGSSLGLRKCRPGSDSVEHYIPFAAPDGPYFWADDPNIVWTIMPDPVDKGHLLLATQGGVLHFDKQTEHFDTILLQDKPVSTVYRDGSSGLIYATVWQDGMYGIDLTTGALEHYPLDTLYGSIWTLFRSPLDDKSLITVVGEPFLGFVKFDVSEKTYSWSEDPEKNPLLFGEFGPSSWTYFDQDSNLWAHSYDQRVQIFLSPPDMAQQPSIRVTAVTTPSGYRTYFPRHLQCALPADENTCQVKFAAVNAYHPDSVQYAFRLHKKDTWTDIGSNRQVTLTNLRHGMHKLFVRASDAASFGVVEEQVITLVVRLPFWRRTWVRVSALLLLALLIAGINALRLRQARSRKRLDTLEKKYAELELTALRAQMNPHFMFNSLNSIKNFILRSERREAAEYLSNFAHLIRMILQYSREKYISLKEELEALMLYIDLEKLRFEDDFEFSCVIDDKVNLSTVEIPPLILQPFVENAIWHGLMHKEEPGNLVIEISSQNGTVTITIDDDGVGREKAAEFKSKSATRYKSMGLGMTRDRIELHNKLHTLGIDVSIVDKKDDLGEPEGTKVIVRIPTQTT